MQGRVHWGEETAPDLARCSRHSGDRSGRPPSAEARRQPSAEAHASEPSTSYAGSASHHSKHRNSRRSSSLALNDPEELLFLELIGVDAVSGTDARLLRLVADTLEHNAAENDLHEQLQASTVSPLRCCSPEPPPGSLCWQLHAFALLYRRRLAGRTFTQRISPRHSTASGRRPSACRPIASAWPSTQSAAPCAS
jgi:hypothetical protein